ncbi:hypothetical protein MASR2M15_27440 [Anaerolineales bacterium]
MAPRKQKRDLLIALNHIERFHRRRMVFTIHLVFSLAIQFAVWANWFASYAARGVGFENNFFGDRIIISVVLMLFLAGHYLIMRSMESKDRLVVKAIQDYGMEAEMIQLHHQHTLTEEHMLMEDEFDDDDEYDERDEFARG